MHGHEAARPDPARQDAPAGNAAVAARRRGGDRHARGERRVRARLPSGEHAGELCNRHGDREEARAPAGGAVGGPAAAEGGQGPLGERVQGPHVAEALRGRWLPGRLRQGRLGTQEERCSAAGSAKGEDSREELGKCSDQGQQEGAHGRRAGDQEEGGTHDGRLEPRVPREGWRDPCVRRQVDQGKARGQGGAAEAGGTREGQAAKLLQRSTRTRRQKRRMG